MIEKFGFVLATKMLVDNRRKVRYMYHESVSNPQDSGWRFFCGDEDDDYVNDSDNIGIYDISTILEFDKSILPYLDCAEGTALEREDETTAFTISESFGADEGRD